MFHGENYKTVKNWIKELETAKDVMIAVKGIQFRTLLGLFLTQWEGCPVLHVPIVHILLFMFLS